jgi:hypothetical protein
LSSSIHFLKTFKTDQPETGNGTGTGNRKPEMETGTGTGTGNRKPETESEPETKAGVFDPTSVSKTV